MVRTGIARCFLQNRCNGLGMTDFASVDLVHEIDALLTWTEVVYRHDGNSLLGGLHGRWWCMGDGVHGVVG